MNAEKFHSQQKVEKLKRKVQKRDARIAELEALIERQIGMLHRYDRATSQIASGATAQLPARELSHDEYDRLIELLDRAIARAEMLTRDKQVLETNLERTLKLLDDALANQEKMTRLAAEAGTGGSAIQTETRLPAPVESALARYDSMLERSLAAIENAYRASEAQKRELDQRDKYLERTFKALDDALNLRDSGMPASPEVVNVASSGAVPGDEQIQATIARYDEMLERSLAALEKAYRENESNKRQIAERDRLLKRTLDTLDGFVENQARAENRSAFSRLFG